MQIDLTKHFKKKELEFSDDEGDDYVPESDEEEDIIKPLKRNLTSDSRVDYLLMKRESIDLEMSRVRQIKSQLRIDDEEIKQRAFAASKEVLGKQDSTLISQKQYVFADKFYTLINQSVLKEVEKPAESKLSLEMSQDVASDYFSTLKFKLTATREILSHLNHNKHIKLSSILKSKFDWTHFIQTEKLEDGLLYHRKNDILLQKFLMNNS